MSNNNSIQDSFSSSKYDKKMQEKKTSRNKNLRIPQKPKKKYSHHQSRRSNNNNNNNNNNFNIVVWKDIKSNTPVISSLEMEEIIKFQQCSSPQMLVWKYNNNNNNKEKNKNNSSLTTISYSKTE